MGATSKPTRRRRLRFPLHRIKQTMTYNSAEIAKLLGVHRNTVRNRIKLGLQKIDGERPALIYGRVLKAFLSARQERNRATCAIGQFYCFRCRAPRSPWGGIADVFTHSPKTVQLKSLCAVCETPVHRIVRLSDLPDHAAVLDLATHASTSGNGNAPQPQTKSRSTLGDYAAVNVAV